MVNLIHILFLTTFLTSSLAQQHGDDCIPTGNPCNTAATFMVCRPHYGTTGEGKCWCQDGAVFNATSMACVSQADASCAQGSPSTCVQGADCLNSKCVCPPAAYTPGPLRPNSARGELYCLGTHGAGCSTQRMIGCISNLQCNVDFANPDTCQCPGTRVWSDERQKCLLPHGRAGCRIEDQFPGDNDNECIDNAVCESNTCQCAAPDFEQMGQQCRRRFEGSCSATPQCNEDRGLICDSTTNQCACPAGQRYDVGTCRKLVGGTCAADEDCFIRSKCNQKTSRCFCDRETNDVELADNTCGRITGRYNGHCESNSNCGMEDFLNCTTTGSNNIGLCLCTTGMQYSTNGCRNMAGQACGMNHGCTPNAMCLDGICECLNGFTKTSGNLCLKTHGQGSCSSTPFSTNRCNLDEGLICRGSTCSCPDGQGWSRTESRCLVLVSGTCTDVDCTENASCSPLGICECDSGFSVHYRHRNQPLDDRYRICVPTFNQTCNATAEFPCNDEEFLTCNSDNRCACEFPAQQEWDSTIKSCASVENGFCGTLPETNMREMRCFGGSDCETESEADVIGRCKCGLGYSVAEGENQCKRSGAISSMNGLNLASLLAFMGLYAGMANFF